MFNNFLNQFSQNPELVKTIALENKEAQNAISWKNWAVNLIKKSEANPQVSQTNSVQNNPEKSDKNHINKIGKSDHEPPHHRTESKINKPTEIPKLNHVEKAEVIEDDDEWAPLEEVDSIPTNTKQISNQWDSNPDDFFDSLTRDQPTSTPKKTLQLTKKNGAKSSVVKKVAASNEDGWGDVDW